MEYYITIVLAFVSGYLLGDSKGVKRSIQVNFEAIKKATIPENKHIRLISKKLPLSLKEKTIRELDNNEG